MGRRSNKELARLANVRSFGRKSEETALSSSYAHYSKPLPKSHRDFGRVIANLCRDLEKAEKNPPRGVSLLHIKIFKKLTEIALREPFEDVKYVECPNPDCRTKHKILCPKCGKHHTIKLPNPVLEKNSMAALLKMSDKLAPNLAAVTQDINVTFLIENVNKTISELIVRYVPMEERERVLLDFKNKMVKVAYAEENQRTGNS
jgi:hypothetical protein